LVNLNQINSYNFIFLLQENKNEIEETSDTFSARMQLQIIQNLELSIHNIHIVYEDKTTKPNHPFAFGITLNSIIFQVEINFQKLLSFLSIF